MKAMVLGSVMMLLGSFSAQAGALESDQTALTVIHATTSYGEISARISEALNAAVSVVDISQTFTGAISNTKTQVLDAMGSRQIPVKQYEILLQQQDGSESVCRLRLREHQETRNAYIDHSVVAYSLTAAIEHCDGSLGQVLPEGRLLLKLQEQE